MEILNFNTIHGKYNLVLNPSVDESHQYNIRNIYSEEVDNVHVAIQYLYAALKHSADYQMSLGGMTLAINTINQYCLLYNISPVPFVNDVFVRDLFNKVMTHYNLLDSTPGDFACGERNALRTVLAMLSVYGDPNF
jgi:hypothetical protein